MGQLLVMPMKAVEWKRDDLTMLVTYSGSSERVIECSHNTPFLHQHLPYSVVHVILTKNNWEEGDTYDVGI